MAEQDKKTDPAPAAESQASTGLSPTNAGWLKALFGDTAAADFGKTIHRSKKIAISLSQDMVGDLATIHHVEIIGVPRGAKIRDGEDLGAGIWRIAALGDSPIVIEPSPENSGPVNLSLKVIGEEAVGGDLVSVMAGVRVFFPPKTPTDSELGLQPKIQPKLPPQPTPEPERPAEPASDIEVEVKPAARATPVKAKRVLAIKSKPRPKQPVKAETQPGKPAAAAVEKPPAEINKAVAPPAPDKAAAEKRTGTGTIVVRLGGAPELGDPHYRISVDARQVASGNVDWGLGLPALDASGKAALFWQTRSIDWDFKDGLPSRISISYENAGDGGLLVDFVEVDGFRIAGGGPFATPSGGWRDAPTHGGHRLWNGEMIFDIAKAYAEPTDAGGVAPRQPLIIRFSADDLANDSIVSELRGFRRYLRGEAGPDTVGGWATAFAENDGVKRWNDLKALGPDGAEIEIDPPRTRPLIIRLDEADIADGAVLAELAELGRYLRGEITDDPSIAEWASTFSGLDDDEEKWSDLVVLGPDGAAIPLPGKPQPLIMRIGAEDLANPALTSQLVQLRRHLRGERDSETEKISKTLAGLESPEGKWNDLLVLDPDGAPVSFDDDDDEPPADAGGGKFSAAAAGEAAARLESADIGPAPADRSIFERGRDAGARLKSGFFAEQLDRAFAAAAITSPETVAAPVPAIVGVGRDDGEQLRRRFFVSVIEIGMEKIRRGINAVTATEPAAVFEAVAAADPEPPSITLSAMSRPTALGVRQGFFTARLKAALKRLQVSRLDAPSATITAVPKTAASTVPWQVGAQLSSDFFNAVIDRAIGRLGGSTPTAAS